MTGDAATGEPSPADIPTPLLYHSLRVVSRIGTTLLFDLKVFGVNNVPLHGGVLLLANHQSYLDPVLIGVKLRRPLSFLAKSELFEHRAFSWLIRNLNAFPVRQGAGDVGAVRETINRLKEGHALVVFPEGTRTEDGEIRPFEAGFSLIVRKANVPVVPVAIHGSFGAWGRDEKMFHAHQIRVSFGPAMDVHHLRPAKIVSSVEQTLRAQFEELRAGDQSRHR